MPAARIDSALLERLYLEARAGRWELSRAAFARALETSCQKAYPATSPDDAEMARYLSALHLEDLALAAACAEGHSRAWDYFVLEFRPALYRAADALDSSGGARELADSLYGELFGVDERGEGRPSLFRYFHGRSGLRTWLRAVLAQRHVDRLRSSRRLEPVPDELAERPSERDPECAGCLERLRVVLRRVVGRLDARDRLRLSCYYAEQLTLSATGRVLREHEATVSRQLARTRKAIRAEVERELKLSGLVEAQIRRCLECAAEDPGPLSIEELLGTGDARNDVGKKNELDRSE